MAFNDSFLQGNASTKTQVTNSCTCQLASLLVINNLHEGVCAFMVTLRGLIQHHVTTVQQQLSLLSG